jgi:carbamoyl-phosphate synthase large subunit
MIAGIGGASLGTEIFKCLRDPNTYTVFGCDISPLAYGHFQKGFDETFVVDRENYIESVLDICRARAVMCIIPGGEQPMRLLSAARDRLNSEGIRFAGNSQTVIDLFSDKAKSFVFLAEKGFDVPVSRTATCQDDLEGMVFPCIVKPARDSGGSSMVFWAENSSEACTYVNHLTACGMQALVQQYVPVDEGEFTVGVLSLTDGTVFSSIALKRMFHTKLSRLWEARNGLISSGYSQGRIDEYPQVRETAQAIAIAAGSVGALNIQGRVQNGKFMPFEINPRFSASTYLRCMAGFNEVDIYLRNLLHGESPSVPTVRPGYYLRSLCELATPQEKPMK